MRQLRPPAPVLEIARRLEAAGFEAWCVGGAVRDTLLGEPALDWDLATPATPEQVIELFGRRNTVPIGIEFGTVAVLDGARIPHEITTFRRDVHTDGRHAVVEFGASLDDDLARRDFTINAIAYRPRTGEVRDVFGGQEDLRRRVVRAVGDPATRMQEDRLRALRGIRFAARYEFTIESGTLAAIVESARHLTRLSAERVQQELVKTMEQVARPSVALGQWRETGALAALVPSLGEISSVALATLDFLPRAGMGGRVTPQRTSNRVAALFLDVPAREARQALTSLRFSKHEVSWTTAVVERWRMLGDDMARALLTGSPAPVEVRRWLAAAGRVHAGGFLRVAMARWEAVRAEGGVAPSALAVRGLHRQMTASRLRDPIELADLAVGGGELRHAGIAAGPIYAKILGAMLELVLEDPLRNTPELLLAELPRLVVAFADEPRAPKP